MMNLTKGTKIVCTDTYYNHYREIGKSKFFIKNNVYIVHKIEKSKYVPYEIRISVASEVKSIVCDGFVYQDFAKWEFEEHFTTLAKYREQQLNEILE